MKKIIIILLLLPSLVVANTKNDMDSILLLISEKPFIALEKIKKRLRQTPDEPRLLFYKGVTEAKLNQIDNAIKTYNGLINKYPNLPEPYNNLAVIYAERQELDLAKDTLEKAIKTNSSYSVAHINLGDIYTQMATNAYNMAFEIDKDNKIARNKLKLITELFNYKPNTNEKSIIVEELDAKIIKIEPRNKSVDKKKIIEKIAAWKTAWEAKDLDSYFDSYSENFKYPNQMNQEQWEKYRRDRIMNKKEITINISNIKTKFKKDIVHAIFYQDYKSTGYQQKSKKTLIFEFQANDWKIIEEFSG
jgi:hypothetical protein|tara:strand:+ start:4033 stop:4944 length:912 start_codon:yes stop_codon:yes gene_type:complete